MLEYIDFFIPAIEEVVAECDRITGEIPRGDAASTSTASADRGQLPGGAAALSGIRDKCINRPLPHESMRPLLNDISVTTRDQLTAFYDLNNAAAGSSGSSTPPTPSPSRIRAGHLDEIVIMYALRIVSLKTKV